MPTRRREQFIFGYLAWLLGSLLILSLLSALSFLSFFIVSLIGFVITVKLTAPFAVTPTWRRRLKWLLNVGLLIFAYLVIRQVLQRLPIGVF